MKRRWTKLIAYAFMLAFVFFTTFLAFNPTSNSSSFSATIAPYRSRFSNLISHYFPNPTSSDFVNGVSVEGLESKNLTEERPSSLKGGILERNSTGSEAGSLMLKKGGILIAENSTSVQIHGNNSTGSGVAVENKGVLKTNIEKNGTGSIGNEVASVQIPAKNSTGSGVAVQNKGNLKTNIEKNQTGSTGNEVTSVQIPGKNSSGSGAVVENKGILKTNIKKNETGSTGDEVTSVRVSGKNSTGRGVAVENKGILKTNIQKNETGSTGNEVTSVQIPGKNSIGSGVAVDNKGIFKTNIKKNETRSTGNEVTSNGNGVVVPRAELKNQTTGGKPHNLESEKVHGGSNSTLKELEDLLKGMVDCDIFHGKWVYDDSYPLYSEGSCPHIDEPFDCFLNGRPDRAYQKLRWQPDSCKIPRFNAIDLLQRLRGKRLAFVGDSLNRNMWESLVCVLWNSVQDKKRVVEAFGRHEFRTEGSYSFLFKDYNCTVEFFRSPFLVQEWEMPDSNGMKKETLRLDIIERSSSGYKDANIIVFNTGHWWTHEKTAKGRDYYQEGNRVYSELNVVEAFHKALHTWALWVDANVDHKKTLVVFRGYSASHFRGGQWNSGGACDRETEPITNESFLSPYPPKMRVLETVLNGMKTRVSYLNITRMTDFRKDAHPSVYRKQNLTDEERQEPERFQDCSHWCLPGVPDSWNELLYAQILIKQNQTPNW